MKTQQNCNYSSSLRSFLGKAKNKFLMTLVITGIVLAATPSRADSGGNQSEQNHLVGTWLGAASPGVAPVLVSYLSDGRTLLTRPITILTGPNSFDTVSTGHGEWARTGNREFASTVYLLSSNSSTEFSVLVKVTAVIKFNRNSDELTSKGTVTGFDPAGNQLFSFPVEQIFKRIAVGQ
jgi:hypothetical protein